MENAVDAIIMGFAMLVFAIAISASMFLFKQIANTSEVILYVSDRTNYFENIEIADDNISTRIVDLDTVIPTLYRYYKENFCVKIYDARPAELKKSTEENELVQIFDVNLEGKVRSSASDTNPDKEEKALIKAYNNNTLPRYLFEAPWIGNTETDAKTRIDLYVQGSAGYINNTYVNYENDAGDVSGLEQIDSLAEVKRIIDEQDCEIVESFVEYAFTGDTISTEDGTETITGDKQEENKIVITYTIRKKV